MYQQHAHLIVSNKRKILSERVPLEPVISENPTQIRVIGEENAVHVPNFSLVPIGRLVNFVDRVNWCELVGVSSHSNPRVEP